VPWSGYIVVVSQQISERKQMVMALEDWFPFLLGLIGATVPVVVGEVFRRKRNKADAADVISQASVRLVQQYEVRLESLEESLRQAEEQRSAILERAIQAETEAAKAASLVADAAEAEHRCQLRLLAMQSQIDELKAHIRVIQGDAA
jgi:isoleucyl-tRNA synthetase